MKHYRSHKIVEAGEIVAVTFHQRIEGGKVVLELVDDEIEIDPHVFQRLTESAVESGVGVRAGVSHSIIGGYFVRYEDGYESWSPGEAFEAGYDVVESPQSDDK